MPPPLPPFGLAVMPSGAWPPVIVRPDMSTVVLAAIVKIRNCDVPWALLRSTVRRPCPGPTIDRLWFISRSPLVRIIGLVTAPAKVMVLPGHASAIASLSEPAPLSALLVTTGLVMQVGAAVAAAVAVAAVVVAAVVVAAVVVAAVVVEAVVARAVGGAEVTWTGDTGGKHKLNAKSRRSRNL